MQKYHFFTTRPLPICQEILPQKDSVRKILSAPTLTTNKNTRPVHANWAKDMSDSNY